MINVAMSNDQLMRYAPSIFTEGGSQRTSDKYKHISTINIVEGLRGEGFMPVKAMQCRSRSNEKRYHTKHMLRFRHMDAVANDRGLYPELVLINSHDGLSSYRLMAGVYRVVCTNGLIAGNTYEEIRVRHQGDIMGNVIEGTYQVMNNAQNLLESSEAMSGIILDSNEKRIFSESVHQLRFEGQSAEESGIKPEQLLTVRRYQENDKNDLFTIFNVAQENVIKGGLRGYALDPQGRYKSRSTGERLKKVTTREVTSIDQSTKLNRALWSLAEKMAELKRAA